MAAETSATGFYLAGGVMFARAAASLTGPLLKALPAAYLVVTTLHLGCHLAHLEGFPVADKVGQTASFVTLLVLALMLLMGARRLPWDP